MQRCGCTLLDVLENDTYPLMTYIVNVLDALFVVALLVLILANSLRRGQCSC